LARAEQVRIESHHDLDRGERDHLLRIGQDARFEGVPVRQQVRCPRQRVAQRIDSLKVVASVSLSTSSRFAEMQIGLALESATLRVRLASSVTACRMSVHR
jgi:hypothetical protein